jgi:hypothetical protein
MNTTPLQVSCKGDRWMAKEGRETIHRLKKESFYNDSIANLHVKKNLEEKMFYFDL